MNIWKDVTWCRAQEMYVYRKSYKSLTERMSNFIIMKIMKSTMVHYKGYNTNIIQKIQ